MIEFFFLIFPPFMFGNSDGKAKGYTINYYYYYNYALILVWKLENKYYILIKDLIQKFIFHVYIIVEHLWIQKKKKIPIIEILRCNLSPYCNRL